MRTENSTAARAPAHVSPMPGDAFLADLAAVLRKHHGLLYVGIPIGNVPTLFASAGGVSHSLGPVAATAEHVEAAR